MSHGKKNTMKKRTSPRWCECGYKRHGANHIKGSHHKQGTK